MFAFLVIFGVAILAVLAIQAADIDCDSAREIDLRSAKHFSGIAAGTR